MLEAAYYKVNVDKTSTDSDIITNLKLQHIFAIFKTSPKEIMHYQDL